MKRMIRNLLLDKRTLLGSLAIMLAALLWSIDGLFIRPKFYQSPVELIVFLEHILGLLVLAPFIYIYRGQIKFLSWKSWLAIVWISIFGGVIGTVAITKAFFIAASGGISFAMIVILQKLQPIFAILLSRLVLREKLTKRFYLWAAVAIIAAYFLAFAKTGLNLSSFDWRHSAALFALIAAFSFGSSTVFGKRITNHLDYKAVTALRFGVTSLLMLVVLLISGRIGQIGQLAAGQWGLLGLIVVTSGAAAMFLYYFGLQKVPASLATILELFWPLSSLVLDYIFNKNYLNLAQSLAALVLLLAFYCSSVAGKTKSLIFQAKVIHGLGRGKKLGFPTANLDKTDLDIPHGVYAVQATIKGQVYSGVMHFGFREVFNEPVSLEVLIKDFFGDIYGETITVEVSHKIREVKKFSSQQALIEAIRRDSEEV